MTRRKLVSVEDAVECDRQPESPCGDCPLRRDALPAWLGGFTPDQYAQLLHSERQIDCHTLTGPQCAGAAIYRANIYKKPRDPAVLVLPRDTVAVFASPAEFLAYHGSKPKVRKL